ncbi:UDP-glucose 4-epimerase GalE [archaeon]|nr:UDP-glucose 4-epimerase GalE [archaeon]
MKNILVTGGAGYIGSVCVKKLIEKNKNVIVIDNLSKGLKELVDKKAKFYEGDLCDKNFIDRIFNENKINEVIHFAGYKASRESMKDVIKYSQNITGTINLLDTMIKYKVKLIVYSSSAGVYGNPEKKIIDENCNTDPINYYGYTKLACENLIKWYSKIYGLKYCFLRYFNVAGDGGLDYIDPDAQNIFPIIMEVIFGIRKKLVIFGEDYNTKDGTCVRDYVHVLDLVDAHISALDIKKNCALNLGSGEEFSLKDLVNTTEKITGKNFNFEFGERQDGEPDFLMASNLKAKEVLNWTPKYSLRDMIESTYEVYKKKT